MLRKLCISFYVRENLKNICLKNQEFYQEFSFLINKLVCVHDSLVENNPCFLQDINISQNVL